MKLDERRRLHGLTKEQLTTELLEAERALLTYRFDAGMNRLMNPAGMHATRKRIAVLKTLIRQREMLETSGFETMDEYQSYKIAERKAFKAARKA